MANTERDRLLELQVKECEDLIVQTRQAVPKTEPQNAETIRQTEARIQAVLKEPEFEPITDSLPAAWRNASAVATFSGGSGTEEDPYIILTTSDVTAIIPVIQNSTNAYYSLCADLDFTGINFFPLGTLEKPFLGHFFGNGHFIKNLIINTAVNSVGFLGRAIDAEVKDVVFQNAEIKGKTFAGVLTGYGLRCTLTNITMEHCSVEGTGYVGGIAGWLEDTTILECTSDVNVTATADYSGGLAAYLRSGSIRNSKSLGIVTGMSYVGGLAGCTFGNITGCTNAGSIYGSRAVGGIAGSLMYSFSMGTVAYCYNTGNILGSTEVGGIAGYAASGLNDSRGARCIQLANAGNVRSLKTYAGGLIGNVESTISFLATYNRGTVCAENSNSGGLVGRLNSDNAYMGVIWNSYNVGHIKKAENAGAIVGYCSASAITNIYYCSEQAVGCEVPPMGAIHTAPGASIRIAPVTSDVLKASAATLGASYYRTDTERE